MQHFKPLKVIGKGSFGEVTKAIDLRTNKVRAIKKIKKSALQKEKGIDKDKEYEILTKLVRDQLFIFYNRNILTSLDY
jgi:serine/threonine protein kinase